MDRVEKSASTRGRYAIDSNAHGSDIDGVEWMPCSKDVDNSDEDFVHRSVHKVLHRLVHRRIMLSIAWISDLSDASSLSRSAIF